MCLHKELKEKTIIKKASFECNKIRRTWGLIELYEQDASHEPRLERKSGHDKDTNQK